MGLSTDSAMALPRAARRVHYVSNGLLWAFALIAPAAGAVWGFHAYAREALCPYCSSDPVVLRATLAQAIMIATSFSAVAGGLAWGFALCFRPVVAGGGARVGWREEVRLLLPLVAIVGWWWAADALYLTRCELAGPQSVYCG